MNQRQPVPVEIKQVMVGSSGRPGLVMDTGITVGHRVQAAVGIEQVIAYKKIAD